MSVSTCMHIPSPQAQTLTINIYSQTLTICINTLVRTYGLCGPQQIYLCNKMSTLKEGNMEYIRITNLVRIRGTHFHRYRLCSSSNCFAVDDLEILQWCHLQCHTWVLEEKMWHSPENPSQSLSSCPMNFSVCSWSPSVTIFLCRCGRRCNIWKKIKAHLGWKDLKAAWSTAYKLCSAAGFPWLDLVWGRQCIHGWVCVLPVAVHVQRQNSTIY